jgi:hypothetical protein
MQGSVCEYVGSFLEVVVTVILQAYQSVTLSSTILVLFLE